MQFNSDYGDSLGCQVLNRQPIQPYWMQNSYRLPTVNSKIMPKFFAAYEQLHQALTLHI